MYVQCRNLTAVVQRAKIKEDALLEEKQLVRVVQAFTVTSAKKASCTVSKYQLSKC